MIEEIDLSALPLEARKLVISTAVRGLGSQRVHLPVHPPVHLPAPLDGESLAVVFPDAQWHEAFWMAVLHSFRRTWHKWSRAERVQVLMMAGDVAEEHWQILHEHDPHCLEDWQQQVKAEKELEAMAINLAAWEAAEERGRQDAIEQEKRRRATQKRAVLERQKRAEEDQEQADKIAKQVRLFKILALGCRCTKSASAERTLLLSKVKAKAEQHPRVSLNDFGHWEATRRFNQAIRKGGVQDLDAPKVQTARRRWIEKHVSDFTYFQ